MLCLQATMLVELLCLLVFTIRLVHYAKVIPRDKFWKDPKNICIIVIVMVGGAYRHHRVVGGATELRGETERVNDVGVFVPVATRGPAAQKAFFLQTKPEPELTAVELKRRLSDQVRL